MKSMMIILLLLPLFGCAIFKSATPSKVAPQNPDVNSSVIYANLYSPVIITDKKVLESNHA